MGWVVFILSLCVAGFQVFYYYDQLPDTMAVHFGTGGEPNGWMTRDGFVMFYFGMIVLTVGVFTGLGALLPRLSPRFINLPHKDYWLAPERRDATLKTMRRWMDNMAAVIAAFIIGMHQMLIDINIAGNPVLNETAFLWGLGAFVAIIIGFTIWLYRRFPKPESIETR